MPRKTTKKPEFIPCATCDRMAKYYRGRYVCNPCFYRKQIRNKEGIVRTCCNCGQTSDQVRLRPDRNQCNPCFLKKQRERHHIKTHGYPPCEVCLAVPQIGNNDGMCEGCGALADEFDRLAEEAV